MAGLSHFGWGVPVWLGCPSCGSSHFEASCPTPSGPSQCPVGRPAWVGCPSLGRLSRVCWVVPVLTGSSQLRVIPAGGCVISQKPMNSHLPANNHTSCEIARAACPPGSSGRTKVHVTPSRKRPRYMYMYLDVSDMYPKCIRDFFGIHEHVLLSKYMPKCQDYVIQDQDTYPVDVS